MPPDPGPELQCEWPAIPGGPFACLRAVGGRDSVAVRRDRGVERHLNIDDRSVRIRAVKSDPAAGRLEPDPSRALPLMTGTEPSIKINPRHADAVVCDPQSCRTSLAGELDHD